MRALEFITGHVIFKLRYDQIYQMKAPVNRCGCICALFISTLFDFFQIEV